MRLPPVTSSTVCWKRPFWSSFGVSCEFSVMITKVLLGWVWPETVAVF